MKTACVEGAILRLHVANAIILYNLGGLHVANAILYIMETTCCRCYLTCCRCYLVWRLITCCRCDHVCRGMLKVHSCKWILEITVMLLALQALKKIRHTGLRPYIVFVASPRLERLHLTRKLGSEKLKKRMGSSQHLLEPDSVHIYTVSTIRTAVWYSSHLRTLLKLLV